SDKENSYTPEKAQSMVADSYRNLALVATRLGDPALAKKIYLDILQYQTGAGKKSFKDPDDLVHAQAGIHQSLADVSWRLAGEPATQDYQQKSLKTRLLFVEKYKFPSVRKELALSYSVFADAQLRLGHLDTAGDYYQKSFDLIEALTQQDSKSEYRWLLANAYYRRGT